MKLKECLDRLLFYCSVPKCVGCGEYLEYGDRGLCKTCLEKYKLERMRDCSRCFNLLSYCTCSNFYLERHGVKTVYKLARYNSKSKDSICNSLIYSLKRDHRRDVIDFLADEIVATVTQNKAFTDNLSKSVISAVPRRKNSKSKYGYDHSKMLAVAIAKRLGVECIFPLKSLSKLPQKATFGEDRYANARFTIRKRAENIEGKRVIIVDDIITTGASVSAAAKLLRKLGAKETVALAVSVAYKDSHIPVKRKSV